MDRILIISGHDFRSPRKANIHFIAQELAKTASVRFLSVGFSKLSLIRADPRGKLASQANVVVSENGVECFLWKTLIHPFNTRLRSLLWLEHAYFNYYRSRRPELAASWMREAQTVIVETGLGIIFIEMIRKMNPDANIIYDASDDLAVIGCSTFVQVELARVAKWVDWVRVPSPALRDQNVADVRVYHIPHGVDHHIMGEEVDSPYGTGLHAVSVGSMLFDESFFVMAADHFPDVQFHVIGSGKTSQMLLRPNIHVYGEMNFTETVKYIKHAKFCIAPYRHSERGAYLADTSMKLLQYDFLGLPAVCPDFAAGNRPHRFSYKPGDADSIRLAIEAAMRQGRHKSGHYLRWSAVAKRLINPEAYPDTPLLPADKGEAAWPKTVG
jgi:2-beta-glucuronyltransferase